MATFFAVTSAPTIEAPLASRIWPRIEPRKLWAEIAEGAHARTASAIVTMTMRLRYLCLSESSCACMEFSQDLLAFARNKNRNGKAASRKLGEGGWLGVNARDAANTSHKNLRYARQSRIHANRSQRVFQYCFRLRPVNKTKVSGFTLNCCVLTIPALSLISSCRRCITVALGSNLDSAA